MAIVETLTVVDATRLDLDHDIFDKLADFYEISNGSYHRYYPDQEWKYLDAEVKGALNFALQQAGVIFPKEMYRPPGHPDGYYNFYILLHFGW